MHNLKSRLSVIITHIQQNYVVMLCQSKIRLNLNHSLPLNLDLHPRIGTNQYHLRQCQPHNRLNPLPSLRYNIGRSLHKSCNTAPNIGQSYMGQAHPHLSFFAFLCVLCSFVVIKFLRCFMINSLIVRISLVPNKPYQKFKQFHDMIGAVNRTQSQGIGLREPLMIIAFWLSL